MIPVQDLNNLYFFAKVVDFGSYTAAAKALGLQTSKLSRRITALEAELGVRLINRTTRRLSLTEAGKTFHRHCLALLDEAQAARDAMSQILASPQGLVFPRTVGVDDKFMFTVTDTAANHGTASATLAPYATIQRQGLPDGGGRLCKPTRCAAESDGP